MKWTLHSSLWLALVASLLHLITGEFTMADALVLILGLHFLDRQRRKAEG